MQTGHTLEAVPRTPRLSRAPMRTGRTLAPTNEAHPCANQRAPRSNREGAARRCFTLVRLSERELHEILEPTHLSAAPNERAKLAKTDTRRFKRAPALARPETNVHSPVTTPTSETIGSKGTTSEGALVRLGGTIEPPPYRASGIN
ncbi:unnamed protein product [Dovyalis caffra]|uniref:Uncharacterized protein n=1 Tax=Dovyalis caffra TaxID=77055 RepID=A0AAV1SJ16_9ROSI|nr:unnamed protein product [Dovyalis caffra]